jgi:hypothetical protein
MGLEIVNVRRDSVNDESQAKLEAFVGESCDHKYPQKCQGRKFKFTSRTT